MPFLEIRGLEAGYGFPVLMGIDFDVEQGETCVLFGLNGAGKTTTVTTISGLHKADGGSIKFDGMECVGKPPTELVAAGISLSPEGRRVFPGLSVANNLRLGAWVKRRSSKQVEEQRDLVFSYFPRLRERADQNAGTLSGGEQQMLAIGRALMSKPRLLLLDEPSLGLAPQIVQLIFKIVRTIAAGGATILLVEQNAHQALQVAQVGHVLEVGQLVTSGPAADLAKDDQIRKAYLGVHE